MEANKYLYEALFRFDRGALKGAHRKDLIVVEDPDTDEVEQKISSAKPVSGDDLKTLLNEVVVNQNAEIRKQQDEIGDLKTQITNLNGEIKALEKKLVSSQEQITKITSERDKLREQVQKKKQTKSKPVGTEDTPPPVDEKNADKEPGFFKKLFGGG